MLGLKLIVKVHIANIQAFKVFFNYPQRFDWMMTKIKIYLKFRKFKFWLTAKKNARRARGKAIRESGTHPKIKLGLLYCLCLTFEHIIVLHNKRE